MTSIRSITTASLVGLTCSLTSLAQADITGFDWLADWQYNQTDQGNPAEFPHPDAIQITNGGGQARSIFHKERQDITTFTARFTLQGVHLGGNNQHGMTFTIHNDPNGCEAIGSGGSGFGYAGILNSGALGVELLSSRSGWFTGGTIGNIVPITGITVLDGHDLAVTIAYDGRFMHQRIVDTETRVEYTRVFIVDDLVDDVEGDLAFVGFTAGTSSFGSSNIFISDFRFVSEFDFDTCAPDMNGDRALDIFDILDFLANFYDQEPVADWNGDTVHDIFDVVEYLADFDAGC